MSQHVDAVYRLFGNNPDEISSWLADAQQAYRGWHISEASVALLEREGIYLAEHEKHGLGFIVGILMDIALHVEKYSSAQAAFHEVYDHAVSTWRTNHISRASGVHPQALTQFNILMQHVKNSAGAS